MAPVASTFVRRQFVYTIGGVPIEFSEMRGPHKIFCQFILQNGPNILWGPLKSENSIIKSPLVQILSNHFYTISILKSCIQQNKAYFLFCYYLSPLLCSVVMNKSRMIITFVHSSFILYLSGRSEHWLSRNICKTLCKVVFAIVSTLFGCCHGICQLSKWLPCFSLTSILVSDEKKKSQDFP